jgi:hypothetical protein
MIVRKVGLLVAILILLTSLSTLAQSQTLSLSIPASGFTPQASMLNYFGNTTGTARFFGYNDRMFAPVYLPDRVRVTSLACGGTAPPTTLRIAFTLRRNEPQQANVDMATVRTTFAGTGFQFVDTTSIAEPVVNNSRFNYYMIAALETTLASPGCVEGACSIGFCRIGYIANQ